MSRLSVNRTTGRGPANNPATKSLDKLLGYSDLMAIRFRPPNILARLPGWTISLTFQVSGGPPQTVVRDDQGRPVPPAALQELMQFSFELNKLKKRGLVVAEHEDHIISVLAAFGANESTEISKAFNEVKALEVRLANMDKIFDEINKRRSPTENSTVVNQFLLWMEDQRRRIGAALMAHMRAMIAPGARGRLDDSLRRENVSLWFEKTIFVDTLPVFEGKVSIWEILLARGPIWILDREWADFIAINTNNHALWISFEENEIWTDDERALHARQFSAQQLDEFRGSLPRVLIHFGAMPYLKTTARTLMQQTSVEKALPKNLPNLDRVRTMYQKSMIFLLTGRTLEAFHNTALIRGVFTVIPDGGEIDRIEDLPALINANKERFTGLVLLRAAGDRTPEMNTANYVVMSSVLNADAATALRAATGFTTRIRAFVALHTDIFENGVAVVHPPDHSFVFPISDAGETIRRVKALTVGHEKKAPRHYLFPKVRPIVAGLTAPAKALVGALTDETMQLVAANMARFTLDVEEEEFDQDEVQE